MVGDLSVHEFSRQLAAGQPTPGGGSAAALVGALGAGLVSMVCNYTVGREQYADVDAEMRGVLARAEELRGQLERAVEDDVAAYGRTPTLRSCRGRPTTTRPLATRRSTPPSVRARWSRWRSRSAAPRC